ncbi:MAG: YraN family protein [Candidatus Uhrbacteria bacterium]|nr:YraN family protein [Candidatus Uhrbacteria bacterium]
MMDPRKQFGNEGEDLAAVYLQKNGYQILDRQWSCVYGEVDLVCKQKEEFVFVEVKSRHDDSYGFPEDAVTATKRRHIAACADQYLIEHHQGDVPWRVDVIAIEFDQTPPNIVHIEAIDM